MPTPEKEFPARALGEPLSPAEALVPGVATASPAEVRDIAPAAKCQHAQCACARPEAEMIVRNGEALAGLCRRHGIRRLAVFGSALRDDFGPDSDIDVLVEFEPGRRVGLRFFTIERELSEIFGRKVDLNTKGFLSPYFVDQVLAEAEDLYVAA